MAFVVKDGTSCLPGEVAPPSSLGAPRSHPRLLPRSSLLAPAALHCAARLLRHRCLTLLVTSALVQALASVTESPVCPLLSTFQAHGRGFNFLSTHTRLSPPHLPSFYSHVLSLLHPLHAPSCIILYRPKDGKDSVPSKPLPQSSWSRTPSPPSRPCHPLALLYKIPFIFQDSVPRPRS